MAGLLDGFNFDDPATQGLLSAAAQMFAASGPSRTPTSLGQILGQGYAGGLQGFNGAIQRKQQADLLKQKLETEGLQNQGLQLDINSKQQAFNDAAKMRQAMIDYQAQRAAPSQFAVPQGQGLPDASTLPQDVGELTSMPQQSVPQFKLPAPTQNQPAVQPQAQSTSPIQGRIDELNKMADYIESKGISGDPYRAKAIELEKLKPKFANEPRLVTDPNTGKPVLVQMADTGEVRPIQGGYGAAPNITEVDLGNVKQFVDKNAVAPGTQLKMGVSPGMAQQNALGWANYNLNKINSEKDNSAEANLPPETLQMMAAQYRAGDTSVLQNLGRGAQGAANIVALRNEIAKQTTAAGQGGTDLAAKNAEYFGTKAGQRTAGTRIANVEMAADEASSLIPLAQAASDKVVRSGFLPFGKGQIMFDNQTNDPNLRQFAAANNALVNVYSRAISPSGTPTVSDKEHAREMLNTAYDQKSYNAVLQQMQMEINAARSAPKAVRQAFNNEVTGKESHAPAAPANSVAQPRAVTLQDIADTAKASGRSTAEVTAALRAKGYTIGGQ